MKQFKIFPNPSEHFYFTVFIFESRVDFCSQLEKLYPGIPKYRAAILFTRNGSEIGRLMFSRQHYTLQSISHESLHAASHYFRIITDKAGIGEYTASLAKEEKFNSTFQYLFSQILINDNKFFVNYDLQEAKGEFYGAIDYYNSNGQNGIPKANNQLTLI